MYNMLYLILSYYQPLFNQIENYWDLDVKLTVDTVFLNAEVGTPYGVTWNV